MAVGADGIMIEVHVSPEAAFCDGNQSLKPECFLELMDELRSMADIFHREI